MMTHPTVIQLAEYHAGLCGTLKSLGIRFHLSHCALCQERLKEIVAEEEEQQFFASEAMRYTEAEAHAEETLQELTDISNGATQKQ